MHKVRAAVVEDVWQGFGVRAVMAGWRCVRPTGFDCIGGQTVQAGLVNKPPVLKAKVQAGAVPGGAVGKSVDC